MNQLNTSFILPHAQVDDIAARQRPQPQGWGRFAAGLQSPVWLTVLGSLVILGMLTAFHQVVHGAVQQGQLLHKTNALQAGAIGRCHMLPGRDASDRCLQQIKALANDNGLTDAASMQLASQ
ncbi:MAG: hypothetical protein ACYC4S_10275 [Rhodoferax sp.]